MNCQVFRNKLDRAVEQRDAAALRELQRVASDDPATMRIWDDHLAIERAIAAWSTQPHLSSPALPSERVEPQFSGRHKRRAGLVSKFAAPVAACTLLLSAMLVLFSDDAAQLADSKSKRTENILVVATALDETAVEAQLPGESDLTSPVTAQNFPSADANPELELDEGMQLEDSLFAAAQTESQITGSFLLDYPSTLAQQGQSLLPEVNLLTLPDVTNQIEQGVSVTWGVIATLPAGMQQAWESLQVKPEMPPESDDNAIEPASPTSSPRKRSRRSKSKEIFSFERAANSAMELLA